MRRPFMSQTNPKSTFKSRVLELVRAEKPTQPHPLERFRGALLRYDRPLDPVGEEGSSL
jgi:hypothetical protein